MVIFDSIAVKVASACDNATVHFGDVPLPGADLRGSNRWSYRLVKGGPGSDVEVAIGG